MHCKAAVVITACLLFLLAPRQSFSQNDSTLDQSAVDSTIRPQDDFFGYANGGWIKSATIPPSQTIVGGVFQLMIKSMDDRRSLMDTLLRQADVRPGSIEQQTADLYASILDSTTINTKGIGPIAPHLAAIDTIRTVAGIMTVAAKGQTSGIPYLFSFAVYPDLKNAAKNIASFSQGGLGLPGRDYYFNQDPATIRIRNAYQTYVATVLTLLGQDSTKANTAAAGVLAVETALAGSSKTRTELRDPSANYHKLTIPEMDRLTPGIDWQDIFLQMHIPADSVLVGQPGFLSGMAAALHSLPIAYWKDYLRLTLVGTFVYNDALPQLFEDARFGFESLLSGTKTPTFRWKIANFAVGDGLPDALGQLYVARFFPPSSKQRVAQLVDNLIAAFAAEIRDLPWMSDSTKTMALIKLHAIRRKIGYPDQWKDYSSITIRRDDAIGNLVHCAGYEYQQMIQKIGKPVDHKEWFTGATTLNAFYDPLDNEVFFPAAFLQPPVFFAEGDDAVNYGAIGASIGHELTHGFDDQGRQFDANGNLRNWWSTQDAARFKAYADKIVAQYNGYIAIDSIHANGTLSLGENIADIGGLAVAWRAFKQTKQGHDSTKLNGLTPDERFFRAFAQFWKSKARPEYEKTSIRNDTHSVERLRVNGALSNLDAFYTTYHLQPTDKLYLPDSLRVHIW
jgi:putative endopeptidase